MIRELNDKASIITTPLDQLTGAQLLEIIEKPDTMMEDLMAEVQEQYHEHHHHHDHEHGEECGCHDHEHHHHDHEHGEECGCHDHEHHHYHDHEHDEECGCHDHEHHHDHEHDHGEECGCHDHEHHNHDHDHGEGCSCGCHDHDHHHHHADEVFTSWGMETAAPIKREDLEAVLEDLAETTHYGEVLRAKGMLPTDKAGEWLYFDLVPEQYEIREGKPDYTGKVCVIGARLKEEELNKAFGRG